MKIYKTILFIFRQYFIDLLIFRVESDYFDQNVRQICQKYLGKVIKVLEKEGQVGQEMEEKEVCEDKSVEPVVSDNATNRSHLSVAELLEESIKSCGTSKNEMTTKDISALVKKFVPFVNNDEKVRDKLLVYKSWDSVLANQIYPCEDNGINAMKKMTELSSAASLFVKDDDFRDYCKRIVQEEKEAKHDVSLVVMSHLMIPTVARIILLKNEHISQMSDKSLVSIVKKLIIEQLPDQDIQNAFEWANPDNEYKVEDVSYF